jgi:hypothetical protein
MKLLDILRNKEELFIIDDVEDKKTKALAKEINTSLININEELESFIEFATSQLEGDYHKKLVNIKSLLSHYSEWNGIKFAFNNAQKEEENKINKLYSNKTNLVNKLKNLMADCQKNLPVIATYHLSNGELISSRSEHETIIIGKHNNNIIEDIISQLEESIVVEGNFDKVQGRELTANFTVVDDNIDLCEDKIDELFANKPAKADKLLALVKTMTTAAENLVFFETYKTTMLEVGCPNKDVDLMEKDLLKKYVPLKKQLQKALKITFNDISSIVVDETQYQEDIEENQTSNETFFDSYSFNENEVANQDSVDNEATLEENNPPIETVDDLDIISDLSDIEAPSEVVQPSMEPVASYDFDDLDGLSLVDDITEDVTPTVDDTNTIDELPPVEDILVATPSPQEEVKAPAKKGRKPTKKTIEATPDLETIPEPQLEPAIEENNGEIRPLDLDLELKNDDEI